LLKALPAVQTKWHTAGLHSRLELLLLTQKHSFNLGSGRSVGSQTPLFFMTSTHVLQFEMRVAEVQLCTVHTS